MSDIIEQCARAIYDDRPFLVTSKYLADMSGIGMGGVIPYDSFLNLGGNDDGIRRHVRVTLTHFKELTAEPTPEMMAVTGMFDLVDATSPDNSVAEAANMLRAVHAKMFEEIGL
jgi:hypothetical protein